jgi:signal transduction histidine kinase
MNVSLQIIDVLPIVQTLVNHYAERALAKNITVQFEHQPEPYQAIVDENTTHQVLDNLISNAVKYSPPNKNITIRLRQEGQHIRCEIQDQGPGLSTADQKKLFGKFNRLTPRPTGGEHSTGLGLFIVKKLIEAMNGKVWCESELGKGATFIAQFQAAEKTSV